MGLKARTRRTDSSPNDARNDARTIALLRGINVGGHNRLPMAELRELIAGLGVHDVQTYIQSGNIVFSGSLEAAAIANAIEEKFGFSISVMTRSAAELRGVVRANPFVGSAEPNTLHVGFLPSSLSSSAQVEFSTFDPEAYLPDRYALIGREIFLYAPNGLSKSPFTSTFFRRLGQPCTVRNWRTVCKLVEIS